MMSTYQLRIRVDVREKVSKRDRREREEVFVRVDVEALDAEHAAQRVSAALAELLDGNLPEPSEDG
jgi:hypothetical protein